MFADALFLLSFVLMVAAARRATAPFGGSMTLAFVATAFLTYASMVVPGILGIFHPAVLTGCYAALTAALLYAGWKAPAPAPAEQTRLTPVGRLVLVPATAIAAVLAVWPLAKRLGLTPEGIPHSLFRTLWLWVQEMTGRTPITLNWDVVSYHLPGLMEFLQNGTLWSFRGPYQSYSYGYELITGFSVMNGGILTVLAGNMLGPALAVAAGALAVRCIGAHTPTRRLGWVYEVLLTLTFASLTMVAVGGSLSQLGKNDVFAAACLLAALALLLQALTRPEGRAPAILGSAAALALAFATKPNTLAYLPLWGATAGIIVWKHSLDRRAWRWLPVAVAAVLAVGMAFSLRNLVAFGSLTGGLTFTAWDKTVAAGARSGQLWNALKPVDYRMMILVGGAIVTLGGLAAILRGLPRLAAAVALAWLIYGLAIFSITPFSLFMNNLQWRMAEFSTLTAMAGFAALLDALAGTAVRRGPLTRTVPAADGSGTAALCRRWVPRGITAAAAVAAVTIAVLHHRHGAFSPQQVIPRAHAGIYDWVAAQPKALRIYAAGLRPYGLFGPGLKHTLFYELNIHTLYDPVYAAKHMNRIRRDFAPDLVIVAIDPHAPRPPAGSWVVPWLLEQPCLTPVRQEPDITVFRVDTSCTTPWGDGVEQSGPLNMEP